VKKEEKEQLEGEKRNEDNRQSEEKRREEETSSKGESLTWRGIQFSSLNISSRPGGGIQLRSGYYHSTAGECAALAIFCCKVNRSLFGRCCIRRLGTCSWDNNTRECTECALSTGCL